jgi:type II secretory pathway component PulF
MVMFFTQIVVPVLLIAFVCFWAGMVWEREWWDAQLKDNKPVRMPVRGKIYKKNGKW